MNDILNLLANLPAHLPDEHFTTLLTTKAFRVERIVSQGHSSPADFWYDQDQHEWILLLEGAARLQFDDHEHDLQRGDSLLIPAHQRHRVVWTDPQQLTIWLAIFFTEPVVAR